MRTHAHPSRARRGLALVLLTALLPLTAAAPGTTQETEAPERLILTPEPGTIFTVEGTPPSSEICRTPRGTLHAKYRGALEVLLERDGQLRIINELTFSHYLRGLAEVPLSWPTAALRAQVIAARSYAMDAYRRGSPRAAETGYHICASDQCQVYRGATVELGAFGERWVRAVEGTRGKVLKYGGRVIQAFYFSTSDGRTRRSFPGGTPQPWLPGVAGRDDDAPLARWTARVRLQDLDDMLAACGSWSGGPITNVSLDGDTVTVRGPSGRRAIPLRDFRIRVNLTAPRLFPGRYPSNTGSATGTWLPQTIPSTSLSMRRRGSAIEITGRGWGHFVGMSQWGARSLAARGESARDILRHYYGPARVRTIEEPGTIRVLAAESLRRVRIGIDGGVTVTTATGSSLAPGKQFEVRGGDGLTIRRGRGPRARGILELTPKRRRLTGETGTRVPLRFTTSRPARIGVTLARADGSPLTLVDDRSFESGTHRLRLRMRDEDGKPLPPGTYVATMEAFDGLDRVRSRPIDVTLTAVRAAPSPPPAPGEPSRALPIVLAVLALAIAGFGLRIARRAATRT